MLKKLLFAVLLLAALVAGFLLAQWGILDTTGALLLILFSGLGALVLWPVVYGGQESKETETVMTKLEAALLLTACKPLADRLAAAGIHIELTNADRAALAGFNQVRLYNNGWWLDEPEVCAAAGLRPSDIGALDYMATMQANDKMRRQHLSGEPLEDI